MARIYLFEDDASLRSLLVEMLQDELGSEVTACRSMAELRERCSVERPDLIVADFWGSSHLQLEERERSEITALASVAPLVLVSARNWAIGAEAHELGVAALLAKPLDIEHFASVIQETLTAPPAPALEGDELSKLPPRDSMSVFVLGWPPA